MNPVLYDVDKELEMQRYEEAMKRVPRTKNGSDEFTVHAYEETLNVPLRALVQSVHYGSRKI
jgi:hypothetical protein